MSREALRAGTESTPLAGIRAPGVDTIADTSADAVYQADADGRIVWMSSRMNDVLGWEPDQLLGTVAADLLHPDDREHVLTARTWMISAGEDVQLDARARTADGSWRPVQLRARALRDDAGTVHGSVVWVRDNTEATSVVRALTTLSAGNRALVWAVDADQLLQTMCDTICEAGGYMFAWYGSADPEGALRPVAIGGDPHGFLDSIEVRWDDSRLAQGPTGICVRTGETQVWNDLDADEHFAPWREAAASAGYACSISMPVRVHGKITGALIVYDTIPGSFDARARRLLEDLADDVGYGLGRLRDGAHLAQALHSSVEVLAASVEARDPYTAGHQSRVATLSAVIGQHLGWDDDVVKGLELGASIHDIGKFSVPLEVLTKPGRLTASDWERLRAHSEAGRRIVEPFPWPWPIADMIVQHHERLDGSGYPHGLTGAQILPEAQVIAIADTFEAMTRDRPFRQAPGPTAALTVLHDGMGRLYDPKAVAALDAVLHSGFTFEVAPDSPHPEQGAGSP